MVVMVDDVKRRIRFGLGNKICLVKVRGRSWFQLNINKINTLCLVPQVSVDFINI